jgi:hypothetical protein
MPLTYANRRGNTYYLTRRQTKTGKAKYHFSKKAIEQVVDEIRAGYEIYERPDTPQVFLRKPISTALKVTINGVNNATCAKNRVELHNKPNRQKSDRNEPTRHTGVEDWPRHAW